MNEHKKEFTQPTVTTAITAAPAATLLATKLDEDFIPMYARADQLQEKKAEAERLTRVGETAPEIAGFYSICSELLENSTAADCKDLAASMAEGDPGKQTAAENFFYIRLTPNHFLHHGIEKNNPYLFFFAYIIGANINCTDKRNKTPLVKLTSSKSPSRSKKSSTQSNDSRMCQFFTVSESRSIVTR